MDAEVEAPEAEKATEPALVRSDLGTSVYR